MKLDVTVQDLRRPLNVHSTSIWGHPQFTSWIDESLSWKHTCYLGDWSFIRSVRYRGPDVLAMFADLSVNTMAGFEIGQSKHLIQCNADGKLIGQGVLNRVGAEEVIGFSLPLAEFTCLRGDYAVTCEAVELTKYHLQGPNALHVLEAAADTSVRDLRFMRFRSLDIAGHSVVVLRQGMSGEIGFELQAPLEHGPEVWAALLEAGADLGIREMGGRVGMINHLEACYPTHTLDYMPAIFGPSERSFLEFLVERDPEAFSMFHRVAGSFESDDVRDWYRSPVEFGWGNRIKFDHDYPGREALRVELADPRRMIATLVWNSDDVIDTYAALFRPGDLPDVMEMPQDPSGYMYADQVLSGDRLVGVTSSRGYSAHFRQMLSLGVVDLDHHTPGTEVTVLWGNPGSAQREIRATVAPAPYKEDRARVDLASLPARPRRPAATAR